MTSQMDRAALWARDKSTVFIVQLRAALPDSAVRSSVIQYFGHRRTLLTCMPSVRCTEVILADLS